MSQHLDNSTILVHRVKTVAESARPVRVVKKKVLFGGERFVLDETLGEDEELALILGDGGIRTIVDAKDVDFHAKRYPGGVFAAVPKGNSPLDLRGSGGCAEGENLYWRQSDGTIQPVEDPNTLPYRADVRVFAVQEDPFELAFTIDLGQEKEGFHWSLLLGGDAKIKNPKAFLGMYYAKAKDSPFTVQRFLDALGTRPANLLLDEILHKSMEVLALDDLTVNVAQWAKERNLTENAFTKAFSAKEGTPFFCGSTKSAIVEFTVNSVKFTSQDRDNLIKYQEQKEEDERKRREEEEIKRKEEEERKRKDREIADEKYKEAAERRQEQLAQKEHEIKMATLEQKIAALLGPRPEIRMKAQVHANTARGVMTRDLTSETSTSLVARHFVDHPMPCPTRSTNRIAIGDIVTLELSANIDGWLHLYNYGTSGKVYQFVPGSHSRLYDGRICANTTYVAETGGDLIDVPLRESGPKTVEKGYLERFIAIITKYPVSISTESVKAVFDKRNPGKGFATRGGFGSVEEVPHAEDEFSLEVAMASLVDLPPEDWVQGTLELEVV